VKDLAILVDNKNDSTEAQDLLFSMGYKWRGLGEISKSYFYPKMNKYFIFMNKNEMDLQMAGHFAGSSRSYAESRFKEITLPELRDMVVLKRSDVGDATHGNSMYPYIKLSDGWYYFDESGKWLKSTGGEQSYYDNLKPITKEEGMKEYLDPENGYKLNLTDRPFFDWIEIPKTAELVLRNKQGKIEFFKDKCGSKFENGNWIGVSIPFARLQEGRILFLKGGCQAYWDSDFSKTLAAPFNLIESRHTLPEELPFVDDKYYTNKSNGVFSLPKSEPCDISNWVEIREEGSLNDQYAEIEKVRQTLSQRQEQYGSFEDVAMITEQMVDVMRKGYYENLAYNQKMALYMICSKMARIVNGNPNHKDSWHDIAGYATLIDNELVSEKDMPF